MDQRRLFIFLILAFAIITVYPMLVPPPAVPPRTGPPPSPTPSITPVTVATPSAPVAVAAPTLQPQGDTLERRAEVLTSKASVAFTNRGARLVSWRLADYTDDRGRPAEMVAVVPQGPRALDIETGDPAVDGAIREALFTVSSEELDLRRGGEGALRFEWVGGDLAVNKEITFHSDHPLVEVHVSVQRGGRELAKRLVWGPGIGVPSDEERAVRGYEPAQAVAVTSRDVVRLAAKKLKAGQQSLTDVRWAGVESRYFTALLGATEVGIGAAEARAFDVPLLADGTTEARAVTALVLGEATGPATLYVGAKDYFTLAPLGRDLKVVVPVGDWIGPVVVPLMRLLRWVHGYVGNYGWSIVLLTLLINLVMGPFRHFGIVNGIKMAKLAPEMRVIQERYRKFSLMDPRRQQMQEEMAALYARHGLSMSTQMTVGCLPLLLTMPFFFAFYRVLDISIELRGAPYLWVPDLSQKDPLFLMPALMTASMFLMQKMMPSAADPAQRRIMLFMPVIFGVALFAAPAGLNLYWLASNLCSIAQQGVTMQLVRERAPEPKQGGRKR
jgi:YidC/Oxa1 family membrane protein insertase